MRLIKISGKAGTEFPTAGRVKKSPAEAGPGSSAENRNEMTGFLWDRIG
jgi:hypothetical protein